MFSAIKVGIDFGIFPGQETKLWATLFSAASKGRMKRAGANSIRGANKSPVNAIGAMLIAVMLAVFSAIPAFATTWTVTSLADSGANTLRGAVAAASELTTDRNAGKPNR